MSRGEGCHEPTRTVERIKEMRRIANPRLALAMAAADGAASCTTRCDLFQNDTEEHTISRSSIRSSLWSCRVGSAEH